METSAKPRKPTGGPRKGGLFAGTPGPGRPKLPPEVRIARRRAIQDLAVELKAAADLAVDRLIAIASNPGTKDSDAVAACREILDRSFGRPVQAVTADVAVRATVRNVSQAEIAAAAALLAGTHR